MALSSITFADKENRDITGVPANQKVTAADMNEIKTKFNALITALAGAVKIIRVKIGTSDFTGGYYDNSNAVGLTPETDLLVFTNEGSGVLLSEGTASDDGYSFNGTLGRFTMDPGNYLIIILKPIA